jgi:hypothetical protein
VGSLPQSCNLTGLTPFFTGLTPFSDADVPQSVDYAYGNYQKNKPLNDLDRLAA